MKIVLTVVGLLIAAFGAGVFVGNKFSGKVTSIESDAKAVASDASQAASAVQNAVK